jgi:hypothetical protein
MVHSRFSPSSITSSVDAYLPMGRLTKSTDFHACAAARTRSTIPTSLKPTYRCEQPIDQIVAWLSAFSPAWKSQ